MFRLLTIVKTLKFRQVIIRCVYCAGPISITDEGYSQRGVSWAVLYGTDLWTARSHMGYIGITCAHIDKLNEAVLVIKYMGPLQ